MNTADIIVVSIGLLAMTAALSMAIWHTFQSAKRSRKFAMRKAMWDEKERQRELTLAVDLFNCAIVADRRLNNIREAVDQLPELVWNRTLAPEHARMIEANMASLVWVKGKLATRADEALRSAYLDRVCN